MITDHKTRRRLLQRWQLDDHSNIMLANITHVLTFAKSDPPWLEVELGESEAPSSSWLRFEMSKARYYVPLGWNEWSVARRISLPIDNVHRGLHIYNRRMTWQIEDRWPTDPRGDSKADTDMDSSSSSSNMDTEGAADDQSDDDQSDDDQSDNDQSDDDAGHMGSGDDFAVSSGSGDE